MNLAMKNHEFSNENLKSVSKFPHLHKEKPTIIDGKTLVYPLPVDGLPLDGLPLDELPDT